MADIDDKSKFDDSDFNMNWGFADDSDDLDFGDSDKPEEKEEHAEPAEKTEKVPEDTEDTSEGSEQSIEDESDDLDNGADEYGTEVDLKESGLTDEDEEPEYSVVTAAEDDFIDDNGDIVVMDTENPNDEHIFDTKMIPIEKISIAADRIRIGSSYESLYKSIRSTGLLEPITVAPTRTDGYYVLLHGYRRLQACAKCGMKLIPCTVNNRVKTAEIPILEALYNQNTQYSMKEMVQYINYLEKEKNIMNASLIEYLLQLNNGDYNKLKDILEDDDPDIAGKLLEDQTSIAQAFKALENKRKKMTREEQENARANKAYSSTENPDAEKDGEATGMESVAGSGEMGDGEGLTDEQIKALAIDPTKLDAGIDGEELDEMVEDGKQMDCVAPHKQDWKDRERIDPAIRKAVMSRDNNTCQCCKRGGPDYVDILDLHHIVEVFLGGADTVENGIALCLNCHKQVHLYAYGQLHIPKTLRGEELTAMIDKAVIDENTMLESQGKPKMDKAAEDDFREMKKLAYKEEQNKYKRIVKLGNVIREGMMQKGRNADQMKKEHPIDKIGRQKPGEKNQIA